MTAGLKVRITYWSVGGKYRRKKGVVTGDLPKHLLNGGDRQAHSLSENPIYVQSIDPFYLKVPTQRLTWPDLTGNRDWRELRNPKPDPGSESMMAPSQMNPVAPVPVPPPPTKAEGLGVLIEEGAVHPVSCVPYTDVEARQKEQADTHAEALQLARAREAKSHGENGFEKAGYIVAMLAAVALVAVIVVVSLQARFGGPVEEPVAVVEDMRSWS